MIVDVESVLPILAAHRRAPNRAQAVRAAAGPVYWTASCSCSWTGDSRVARRPTTDDVLRTLDADHERHLAEELLAAALTGSLGDGITVSVQLAGQTLPGRPFQLLHQRHLTATAWRNARAANRHGLGMLPALLQAAAVDAMAELTRLANIERVL